MKIPEPQSRGIMKKDKYEDVGDVLETVVVGLAVIFLFLFIGMIFLMAYL